MVGFFDYHFRWHVRELAGFVTNLLSTIRLAKTPVAGSQLAWCSVQLCDCPRRRAHSDDDDADGVMDEGVPMEIPDSIRANLSEGIVRLYEARRARKLQERHDLGIIEEE